MKIQNISNFYNPFKQKVNNVTTPYLYSANAASGKGDVVSFSAKKYDSENIINPTYHCAYCGCKVYTEEQIDSIANEMLNSKASRLEGHIRSVLEKLELAKHSQEIAVAKKLENEEEIEFFKKLLDVSSKKSFLKAEDIFVSVYDLDREQAKDLIVQNMHPLQRTIDHISPQREDKENKDSDINLVEACYCCNHDLKKGSSFEEFYTMFPSIKNNMPNEKFQYAFSNLLDSSQNHVAQRLSASNMLKLLKTLFVERKEASNYLDSVDFRIRNCKSGIENSIQSCKADIAEKEIQKNQLEIKLEELKQDPEYNAMLERISISSQINSVDNLITAYRDKKQKISYSLNELNNPKTQKKTVKKLSEEDKKKKILNLKESMKVINEQIAQQEQEKINLEQKLADLNAKFPSIQDYQDRKSQAENIYNAHIALKQNQKLIIEENNKIEQYSEEEAEIQSQIDEIGVSKSEFKPENYSSEQQVIFARYKELTEALDYIELHQNVSGLKNTINNAAKEQIVPELERLENEPVVSDYKKISLRKELLNKLSKVKDLKTTSQKKLVELNKQAELYRKESCAMSEEDAKSKIQFYSETIRRLNDKKIYTDIPKKIDVLNAEILLLRQTVIDLETQQKKIDTSNT